MCRAQNLAEDRERTFVEVCRIAKAILKPFGLCQTEQNLRNVDAVRTKDALANIEGASQRRFSLVGMIVRNLQQSEFDQTVGDSEMITTELAFPESQNPVHESRRDIELSLRNIETREIDVDVGNPRMVGAERVPGDRQRLRVCLLGAAEVAAIAG